MSDTNVMPSPQEAFQNIYAGVRQRVFFHKLATVHGIQPKTEKQAAALLNMADQLRLVDENETVKAAADANDPFIAADQALSNVLTQYGIAAPRAAASETYKEAIDAFANDPLLYNSILALHADEADQTLQQIQRQRQSA
jgi:hypothetical protein